MLLLAVKTSGVGHVVGENIDYFYEKTTDFVSADVISLVYRLSFLCCASALPNPGFSKLLVLEVVHEYLGLRQSQHGGVDVEGERSDGSSGHGKNAHQAPNQTLQNRRQFFRVLRTSNPAFLH